MSWDLSTLDPTDDHELFDGLETIRYQHFDPATDSFGTAYPIENVLAREVSRDDLDTLGGEIVNELLAFSVPWASFESSPSKGDRIIRDGTTYYYVQKVRRSTLGTRAKLISAQGDE